MKKWLAALLVAVCSSASATTVTRDYSDLWYIPAESGWGANMIQQGDVIFLTMFVYASNSQPIWFVASEMAYQGGSTQRFTGTLYQTSGPYFGGVFNPANVTVTAVGQATFTATSASVGTLTYSVNGVNVTKNVVRNTWRTENISGVYQGATIGTYSGCSAGNGPYDSTASFTFNQTASNVAITEFGTGYQCTYTGTYTQSGHNGTVIGTGSCQPNGAAQVFTASDIDISQNGINMVLVADAGACHFVGRIGGVRRQ